MDSVGNGYLRHALSTSRTSGFVSAPTAVRPGEMLSQTTVKSALEIVLAPALVLKCGAQSPPE